MAWVWEQREDRARRGGMEPPPVLSLLQAAVVAPPAPRHCFHDDGPGPVEVLARREGGQCRAGCAGRCVAQVGSPGRVRWECLLARVIMAPQTLVLQVLSHLGVLKLGQFEVL